MPHAPAVDLDRVVESVEAVVDPEMTPVTIGMLGMVHDVAVTDEGVVRVELLPTFAGCPATDMIRRDVRAAVADLADDVEVVFRFTPAWTPARITDEGRQRLAEFGIAPPTGGGGDVRAGRDDDVPDTARSLPIVTTRETGRTCPWCGSTDTTRDSQFGPTPCRDLWMCTSCRQPFEGFKS